MIQSFNDEGTKDIFNGLNTKAARNICPEYLWKIAERKLDLLDSAEVLRDLRAHREIDLNASLETVEVSIVSVLMIAIESASFGRFVDQIWLRSSIITRQEDKNGSCSYTSYTNPSR